MSRGGKRAGAGRCRIDPQLVKINPGYKLSRWVIEWLRAQEEPAGPMLERALIEKYNLKPPQG